MAKAGRRVAVTERGALVAYLVPAEEPAGLLARLAAAGQYLPPVGSVLDLLGQLDWSRASLDSLSVRQAGAA